MREYTFSCVPSGAHFLFKGEFSTPNYEKMYYKPFNAVTDVIDALQHAQSESEEEYINSDDSTIKINVVNNKDSHDKKDRA